MFDSNQKRSILRADYQRRLGGAEYIYLDSSTANLPACSLLLEDVCNARTAFRLIMPLNALDELFMRARAEASENALLRILRQVPPHLANAREKRVGNLYFLTHENEIWSRVGDKVTMQGGESDDAAFLGDELLPASIMHKAPRASQVLISQDRYMQQALHETARVMDWDSGVLSLLSMNERGELYEPFALRSQEEEEGLAEVAAMNLESIVCNNHLCIDCSALGAACALLLLRRVKPLVQKAGKCLNVLVFRNELLPHAALLIARAQEQPPTVRFVWLDGVQADGDAPEAHVLAALETHSRQSLLPGQQCALISNAPLTSKLPARTVLYSVNRHGFLTRRVQPGAEAQDSTQPDYKASLQEQMKEAVMQGDTETARKLAVHHQTLEIGLYTALLENNADMLDMLVEAADRFPSRTLRWWLLDSHMFRNPGYLAANPRFYHIMVKALSKAEFGAVLAGKISHRLWELRSLEGASVAELDFLISLFREAIESSEPNAEVLHVNRENCMGELPHTFSPEFVRVKDELRESEFALGRLKQRLQELEQQLDAGRKEQQELAQRRAQLFMEHCVLSGPILMDSSALLCGHLGLFRQKITPILLRYDVKLSASCSSRAEVAESPVAVSFLRDKSIMMLRRDEDDSANSADVLLRVLMRCGSKVRPVLITQRRSLAQKALELSPGTLVCSIDSEGNLQACNN